jgi:hypothetical protein
MNIHLLSFPIRVVSALNMALRRVRFELYILPFLILLFYTTCAYSQGAIPSSRESWLAFGGEVGTNALRSNVATLGQYTVPSENGFTAVGQTYSFGLIAQEVANITWHYEFALVYGGGSFGAVQQNGAGSGLTNLQAKTYSVDFGAYIGYRWPVRDDQQRYLGLETGPGVDMPNLCILNGEQVPGALRASLLWVFGAGYFEPISPILEAGLTLQAKLGLTSVSNSGSMTSNGITAGITVHVSLGGSQAPQQVQSGKVEEPPKRGVSDTPKSVGNITYDYSYRATINYNYDPSCDCIDLLYEHWMYLPPWMWMYTGPCTWDTSTLSSLFPSTSPWCGENLKLTDSIRKEISVIHSKDSVLHSKDSVLHSKDSVLHSKDSVLHSKDSVIQSKDSVIQSKDSEIGNLKSVIEQQKGKGIRPVVPPVGGGAKWVALPTGGRTIVVTVTGLRPSDTRDAKIQIFWDGQRVASHNATRHGQSGLSRSFTLPGNKAQADLSVQVSGQHVNLTFPPTGWDIGRS